MNNVEFTEFQSNNTGSAYKYTDSREVNEHIHIVGERKKNEELFTLSDWQKRSDHFINTHVWDIGKGEFVQTKELVKEMNKAK